MTGGQATGGRAVRLGDDAAREEVRTRLGATLFVEAGAGSGKTTTLVGRIVELVCSGVALLGEIAAITFTEAAAAELRTRVRRELERVARLPAGAGATPAGGSGPDGPGGPAEADRSKRACDALERIDEAVITTIHGFCQRLLAEHPVEAGLPPRFEVLDEVRQSLAWKAEWEAMVDALGGDEPGGELFEIAALLGLRSRRLEELARTVAVEWDDCQETGPDVESVVGHVRRVVESERARLAEALRRVAAARAGCSDTSDRLFQLCLRAEGLSRLVASSTDWRDLLALIASKSSSLSTGTVGSADNWGPEREMALHDVKLAVGYRRTVLEQVNDLALPALGTVFDVFARRAAGERRRRGELLFHDLLVFARDLLAEHDEVRRAVRARYRYLLVDEFQDTDPLQLEIAELIGRPVTAGVEAGRLFPLGEPEPGRLFYVGDPQQSIYRFRGADLAAYASARDRFAAAGGRVTSLTSNFRSVPGVLDFVNACFARLLHDFTPLAGVRGPLGGGPAVHLVGGPFTERLSADERRRREAADCVRLLRRAVGGGWTVGDESAEGGSRPARLGDVALLVPRRTGLGVVEELLDEAGIGYRIESAELIYRSQEVRELLALCRALGSPGDPVALVAVLRSSLLRCGDDDLHEYHRLGGRWSLEEPLPDVAARAAEAGLGEAEGARLVASSMRKLGELRAELDRLGPVATLEAALRALRVLELAACSRHPREAWRRVRFLTERLRAFVASGGGGLFEFADWVEDQLREGLRPVESVLPEPDEDVVRIMTVHGAKGLEFPVTVLLGFGTTEASNLRPLVLRNPQGGCEVHFNNDTRTSGHEALYRQDQQLSDEEELRLLYVAATRARDHLVVCVHHSEKSPPSMAERLLAEGVSAEAATPGLFERIEEGDEEEPPPLDPAAVADGPQAPPTTAEDVARFAEGRRELLERARRRTHLRATEVPQLAAIEVESWQHGDPDHDAGDGRDESAEASAGGGPLAPARIGRRGRAGTQLGRAVHASLQSLAAADARLLAAGPSDGSPGDGPGPAGAASEALSRICVAQARAEQIPPRTREVERLVRAALSSPTVREAFASGRVRRELYVSAPVGDLVLDGFVDLCFETAAGGLVVVDYKTDTVRDLAEVEERVKRYELQVAAYALALSAVTGQPVERGVLVFLAPPNETIEVSVSPLDALVRRVRDLVEAQ